MRCSNIRDTDAFSWIQHFLLSPVSTAKKKVNWPVFGSSYDPCLPQLKNEKVQSKTSSYEIPTKAWILLFRQRLSIQIINWGMKYLCIALKFHFTYGTISNRWLRETHHTGQNIRQEERFILGYSSLSHLLADERFSLGYSFLSPCWAHLPQHFMLLGHK